MGTRTAAGVVLLLFDRAGALVLVEHGRDLVEASEDQVEGGLGEREDVALRVGH